MNIAKKKEAITEKVKLETTSQAKFYERNYLSLCILFVCIISFSVLTYFVKIIPYFPIDLVITRSIQSFHPFWFDRLMAVITFIGDTREATSLVIITGVLFVLFKRYKEGIMTILSSASMTVIGMIAKQLVGRVRPSPTLIHQIGIFTGHDSFPSGHVLFYVGFFGFIVYLSFSLLKKDIKRTFILTFLTLLIGLIGVSRIYRGAHWFSDVLGAYLSGVIWLTVVTYIYKTLHPTT